MTVEERIYRACRGAILRMRDERRDYSTEREARKLARFIREILNDASNDKK